MSKNHTNKRGIATRMMDLFRTRRGGRRAPTRGRRLSLEPLETRTLLAIVSMSVDENPGTIVEREGGECTLTFTITPEEGDDIKAAGHVLVSYSISGLQPHEYEDGGCVGGSVAILTGQDKTTAQVTIKFLNDAIAEGDDTCTIKLESAEAANPFPGGGDEGGGCCCCGGGGCCGTHVGVVANQEATVTILDDDHWAIQVEAESPNEIVERDGVSGYTISRVDDGTGRSGDTTYAIAVDFAMSRDYGVDYTLSGPLTSVWNYQTNEPNWRITLPAGGGSAGVGLSARNNAIRQDDRDVELSIVSAKSVNGAGCFCGPLYYGPDGTYGQTGPEATVTILDDDHWAIQVERTSAETILERSLAAAQFTVTRVDDGTGRSGDLSYGILVNLDPTGGSATYGIDFALYDDDNCYLEYWQVTIPADDIDAGIKLLTNNDYLWESDEDAVTAVTGGTSVGLGGGVYVADPFHPDDLVYILDDDHWVVSLIESGAVGDPRSVIQEEGQTSKAITLVREHEVMVPARTGDTTYGIEVAFAYAGLANNNDYVMIDQVIQPDSSTNPTVKNGGTTSFEIQEGQTEKQIDIQAVDDILIEHLYQLLVITITAATHGTESYHVGVLNTVELDIEDNDTPVLKSVWYAGANPYVTDPEYVGAEFNFVHENIPVSGALRQWFDRGGEEGEIDLVGESYSGDKRYPVTYERSVSGGPESRFQVQPLWWGYVELGLTMTVAATGPDGMLVPVTATDLSTIGEINTGVIQSTGNAFPESVKHYPQFTLTWTFAIGGETLPPRSAGENWNEMYVTYDVPVSQEIRHTSLHLGTVAADGDDELLDVVDDAWGAFADRDVERRDGTTMTYYADPETGIATVPDLLKFHDGACVAWAKMLLDVYCAQGIQAEGKVFSSTTPGEYLLINNYTGFDQEGIIEKGAVLGADVIGGHSVSNYTHAGIVEGGRITAGDLTDQMGIPGQSNPDPTSFFRYHAIVRMGLDVDADGVTDYRYFDPSYGEEYVDWAPQCPYTEEEYDWLAIEDFVSTALAGLYVRTNWVTINETVPGVGDWNGDGNIENPEFVSQVFLIREGNPGDIKLE